MRFQRKLMKKISYQLQIMPKKSEIFRIKAHHNVEHNQWCKEFFLCHSILGNVVINLQLQTSMKCFLLGIFHIFQVM